MIGYLVERAFKVAGNLPKPLQNPILAQQATLRTLIDMSQNTAFGRHFGYNKMLNHKDIISHFRNTVPIYDYPALYDQWWHRLLECEADVCWPGRVKYFALSSGTSGAPSKYIPVTTDMQRSMRRAGLRLFMSLPKFGIEPTQYSKAMLMIGSSASLIQKNDYFIGDLSGINSRRPPFWIRGYYKPGTEIAKTKDWNERTSIIVRNAPNWDIGYVTGIPSWVLMTLQEIIDYYKLDSIHDIWPNLKVFVSGGINYKPYKQAFRKIFNKEVFVIDSYLASEGFVAFQNRPDTSNMALVFQNGLFYEFIPFNSNNYDDEGNLRSGAQSLLINEVEPGVDYSLVLSTNSGAWRYQIGDLVRFNDVQKNEIIITGRTSHFLSVVGEHLSVGNMTEGILAIQEELGNSVKEFTVFPVQSGKFFAHRWYIGTDKRVDPDLLAIKLDAKLCEVNDDYSTERSAQALDNPQIKLIPNEWFYEFMSYIGKLDGQAKFPRVLKNEFLTEFEKFVAAKGSQLVSR